MQAKPAIPDQEALLNSLKRLAWQLQGHTGADEARTTLSQDEAAKHQLISPEQLQFAASASLLELTNQTVRFSHQLLQEYFTAQSFEARSGKQQSPMWNTIRPPMSAMLLAAFSVVCKQRFLLQ